MSQNYRVRVTVELDVMNAECESQARQTVFSLLSAKRIAIEGEASIGSASDGDWGDDWGVFGRSV